MSGGSGTRLWPASTDERPKQFHALGSPQTMLQEAALRVRAEGFLEPLVICN
ncbi:sugar phosphate nucleotidyltransferase, partial [Mycobacterium tuberculosis]